MHDATLLLEILTLLAAAMVLGAVFARLRQSAILGYLLAGTLLGPNALNWIHEEKHVETIAELGVALLLFSLGLEFSWRQLRAMGRQALVGGSAQIVSTLLLVAAVAIGLGAGGGEALAIGAMVCLSSTACVLRVLMDRAEMESITGRNSLGILLMQDIAVVPLAVLVSVLGGDKGMGQIGLDLGRTVIFALGLVAVLYVLLNWVAVGLLGTRTVLRNRELAVLLAVVTGLGAAAAAQRVGLSPALGAFVAGIFLGGSPFATQIRADIGPLRVVLLTLFFSAVGMLADPMWILDNWAIVLAVVAGLIVGKAALIWMILRLFGQSHSHAIATGVYLSQVGEFAFVLGSIARNAPEGQTPVLSEDTFMLIASAAIVTLLITPYLIMLGPRLGGAVERMIRKRRGAPPAPAAAEEGQPALPHVLLVGFGPAGRQVGEALSNQPFRVTVIELNPQLAEQARQLGFEVHMGDATHADVLQHAHIGSADVVVITLPDPGTARHVIEHARHMVPSAQVIVRARYHAYRYRLQSAGANIIIDEESEVGARLAGAVRRHCRALPGRVGDFAQEEPNPLALESPEGDDGDEPGTIGT